MSVGKIAEFNVATDNWRLYVDRLEQYFVVNKVDKDMYVSTLITVMGADCYELLVNLCTPDKPISKTFTEVTNILERHLQPKHSILAERYKFRHRKQASNESISEYVAVLKKMTKTCEFGTWLEESLRDQLVCGIRSETIRQRLFTEEGLYFERAFKLAVSMEAAERDAAVVEGRERSSSGAVVDCQAVTGFASRQAKGPWASDTRSRGQAVSRPIRGASTSAGRGGRAGFRGAGRAPAATAARASQQCMACGAGHDASTCRFTRYVCKVCNRQGHLQRMCPYMTDQHCVEAAPVDEYTEHYSVGEVAMGQEQELDVDSDVSFEVNISDFNQLSITDCKPITIPIYVHGKLMTMECDTGSAVSCINYEMYQRSLSDLNIEKTNLRLRYYTGELVCPVGVVRPLVKYRDKEKYLDLYVVDNGKTSLLGRQWLAELEICIPIPQYCNVNNVTGNHFKFNDFSSRYRDVFADGLGRFTGGRVGIHLREGARPVFLRARPLAYALREPVERALEQLVRDGVLTPVDRSDWATPIVPVVKKDGSIRICADYKLTLNRVLEVDRYPLPRVEDLLVRLHGGERFSKIDLPRLGLRSGVKFVWNRECQAAFESVKDALVSSEVLVHYASELPLVLTADASAVGVGCVLSHLTPAGERPVAYASRTLTPAEHAYAQIDREALAIIYGIRKFHQYLYGRKFTLRTDHKPLTYIFGDKVGIPVMAASRLQRWAVLLSGYTYKIEYVPSARNCADALSRLPQAKGGREETGEKTYLNFVEDFLPITNNDVRIATAKDKVLSRTLAYVQSGWPASCPDDEMKPYFSRRNELYVDRGCVMWGYRVVVPPKLQASILKQLHVSHMGIVKTKSLARSYVWWPNIDADAEALCRACAVCAAEAPAPPRAPPAPWQYVPRPWTRLHADFLSLKGKSFLVVIDSSTKWLEIVEMTRTNAAAVIKELRPMFARFGVPEQFVSDQGPPFSSSELKDFLVKCGVRQSFSPVYHPASNGAAECAVKLCKRAIKKAYRDGVDVDAALQTYLLAYRTSVHSTTGESPAMLLQRRSLRTRLDLLRADAALEECVRSAQARQVAAAGGTRRALAPGDEVWARGYGAEDKWIKGAVVGAEGSRRYTLNREDGKSIVRHIDQVRHRSRMSTVPCPGTIGEADGGESGVMQPSGQTEVVRDRGSTVIIDGENDPVLVNARNSDEPNQSLPSLPPRPPETRPPMNLRPLPHRTGKFRLEID